MKVALVQMPPQPRDTPPFEMALTAAVLRREGHEVSVFDVNNELYHETFKQRPSWKFRLTDHSTNPHGAIFQAEWRRFVDHALDILAAKPDAVVFKMENVFATAVNMALVMRWLRRLIALSDGAVLIASGAMIPDRERVLRWVNRQNRAAASDRVFDWHVLFDDNVALPALLSAIEEGGLEDLKRRFQVEGRFIDGRRGPQLPSLDELPPYDFRDYDISRYGDPKTLRWSASRSCVMHCAFCQDWLAGGKFRTMSGDRWFEEYKIQHDRHPHIQHYQYYDRLLNGDIAVLERYVDRLLSEYGPKKDGEGGPPVIWSGDFIIRSEMTDDLIKKMALAQCGRFGTGFESGSERVRASVFKDFFTNEVAARVFASCRRHGINVAANILIGLPTETREGFEETIRFVEQNHENIWELRLTAPTVRVEAGTPLHRRPARFGIVAADHEKWVARDGQDYAERVRRFEEFCLWAVALKGPRLAVNRRIVKNAAQVRTLVEECLQGPASDRPLAQADTR